MPAAPRSLLLSPATCLGLALGLLPVAPGCATPPNPEVTMPPTDRSSAARIQDLPVNALDGRPFDPTLWAGKAVLVVNVASFCGFTKQYAGLEDLYQRRKDDGLVIVGVPCNQFGAQEPGGAEEIATFCSKNYGVTFPLLEKQDVNGSARGPLYSALVDSEAGRGKDIRWNFEKFVVGRDGRVVARFGSSTAPDDAELAAAIDRALGAS